MLVRPVIGRCEQIAGTHSARSDEYAPAPRGVVPSATNGYRYAEDSLLYGIALTHGAWTVTALGGGPINDSWSEPGADIAPDGHGGAMVVYQAGVSRTIGASVWARRFSGGSWGPPTQLLGQLAPGRFSDAPRVAMLPNGDAVAVYSKYAVQWSWTYARVWDGNVWGPEQLVQTDPVWPDTYSLAAAGDGTVRLTYALEPLRTSDSGTLVTRLFDGSTFGPAVDGVTLPGYMGQTRTLAGAGSAALLTGYDDGGVHAQSLTGGVFSSAVNVGPFIGDDQFYAL